MLMAKIFQLCSLLIIISLIKSLPTFCHNSETDYRLNWIKLENFTSISINQLVTRYEKNFTTILDSSNVSVECQLSLRQFINDLKDLKINAIRQLDSWGRLPSGLLDGSWTDFGSYHQCMQIPLTQYCFMFAKMPLMPANSLEGWHHHYDRSHFNLTSETFQFLSDYAHLFRYLNVTTGLCVPRDCSKNELKSIVVAAHEYYQTGFQADVDLCQTYEPPSSIHFREYIAGFIVTTIVILNILGSLVSDSSWAPNFLQHFNFITNWSTLFKARSNEASIPCLDGLKSLTMAFMILIHSFFLIFYPKYISSFVVLQTTTTPLVILFFLGPFTVDTFFLITGLETTIAFTGHLRRRFAVIPYLVLRYIRFVPVIGWTIACYILLFSDHVRNSIGGPFWPFFRSSGTIPTKCATKWPLHLALIAHYFNEGKDEQLCLLADWYLEADYAFAILFLAVLIPFLKGKTNQAYFVTGSYIVAGCAIIGFVCHFGSVQHTWQPLAFQDNGFVRYLAFIHGKPWGHISPYFIGVFLGFLINDSFKANKIQLTAIWIGWIACWIILLTYECAINLNLFHVPYLVSLAYAMFSKVIWSLIISWIIFSCHAGYAHRSLVRFLSRHGFTVLSRINLSVLFVNFLVIRLRNATLQSTALPTLTSIIFSEVIPLFVVIYAVSFLFCVLVEGPTINLIKDIVSRKPRQRPMTGTKESSNQVEHSNL